jgi:hypothetical protein
VVRGGRRVGRMSDHGDGIARDYRSGAVPASGLCHAGISAGSVDLHLCRGYETCGGRPGHRACPSYHYLCVQVSVPWFDGLSSNLLPPFTLYSRPSLSRSARLPVHLSSSMYVQCSAVQITLMLNTHLEINVSLVEVSGGGERSVACEAVSEVQVSFGSRTLRC